MVTSSVICEASSCVILDIIVIHHHHHNVKEEGSVPLQLNHYHLVVEMVIPIRENSPGSPNVLLLLPVPEIVRLVCRWVVG